MRQMDTDRALLPAIAVWWHDAGSEIKAIAVLPGKAAAKPTTKLSKKKTRWALMRLVPIGGGAGVDL
jgi:hypothetical protein